MFPPLPSRWREIGEAVIHVSSRGLIAGLLLATLTLLVQWKKAENELKLARLAYLHPQIKEVVRTVRVEGPVRIRTVVVEKPTGERETTTEETHEAIRETNEAATETKLIPVGSLIQTRTDRYLVTLGMGRLSSDFDGKALFVGYGFKNRLDIQAGVVHRDGTSPWILATFRF